MKAFRLAIFILGLTIGVSFSMKSAEKPPLDPKHRQGSPVLPKNSPQLRRQPSMLSQIYYTGIQ
jgi:hypothetical protein